MLVDTRIIPDEEMIARNREFREGNCRIKIIFGESLDFLRVFEEERLHAAEVGKITTNVEERKLRGLGVFCWAGLVLLHWLLIVIVLF